MPKRAARDAREPYFTDVIVPAVGPQPCDALLVGEAPGETEHRKGKPFCGKTGDVLTTYLRAANIPRPNIRITNLVKIWTGPGNPDPTPAQIKHWGPAMLREIAKTQPKVIATVGRIATQWFLGDIDMDACHGVPAWSTRAPNAIIVPCYHPSAGFYRPELAAFSQEDFMRFAFYLLNPVKQLPLPDIDVIESINAPYEISGAVDTEGLEDRPWGLSWSGDGRTTNVWIKKGNRSPKLKGRIVFHNALHDLKILRSMGIDTDGLDYDDTMVKLYLLQLEPQGLKAAAYRHLGLRMHSFDDVVRPHFNKAALEYLRRAALHKYKKSKSKPIADYTKRKWRLYKPWDAGRRLKSALTSWDKRQTALTTGAMAEDDKPIKLEKKWQDLGEDYHAQITTAMGEEYPDFSIFCVPRAEAVQYSGIDAAATALLNPVLDKLIDAKGLRDVYNTDRRYIPFVDKMQETGMRVEVPLLRELEVELEGIRDVARRKVQRIVGDHWFNPGSDDQVGRWLYKVKGLPIMKYTEGGEGSTSLVTLKMLQGYHGKDDADVMAFTSGVREYRESDKYLGTFIQPIFEHMRQDKRGDWRIHPNYRITRVVSGRNCLAAGTKVEVVRDVSKHPAGVPIENVRRGDYVYCFDDKLKLRLRRVSWAGKTGHRKLVRVHWRGAGGKTKGYVDCTPDHRFRIRDGSYKRAGELAYGDSILAVSRSRSCGYDRLHVTGDLELRDHVFIYRELTGSRPEHVHHKNENKRDNRIDNLEGMTQAEHVKHHGQELSNEWKKDREGMIKRLHLRGAGNGKWLGLTRSWMIKVLRESGGRPTVFRDKHGIDYETAQKYMRLHNIDWKKYRSRKVGGNHFVTSVEPLPGLHDVYDLEVEGCHNFIANELCVHNSSHDPNVMAFPTRTELGAKIRRCFAAARDHSIVSIDMSQIELRVMAHLCRDKTMRRAFEEEKDLHTLTASMIFKVPIEKVTKPQRFSSKTVGFGVMYGISPRALLEQLYKNDIFDFTLEDCQRFISQWFGMYPSVQEYLHRVWVRAQKDGFVRDMWSRLCYVPNLRVGDDRMREAARRLAGNMPVQGGARGLVKRAQIRVHDWLSADDGAGYQWAHPWLDMHDELTSEVRSDMAEEFAKTVQAMFCADQDLIRVPIKAETGIGDSWATAK